MNLRKLHSGLVLYGTAQGFAILFILPIIFVALASTAASVKLHQTFIQDISSEEKLKKEEVELAKTMIQVKAFKQKLANYGELGVDIAQVATESAKFGQLILDKNFGEVNTKLASFSATLDELLVKKEVEEAAMVSELKIKVEAKVDDYKKLGVNVASVEKQLVEVRSLIDQKEFEEATKLLGSLTVKLGELLAAKKAEEAKAEAAKAAAAAPVVQVGRGTTFTRKTVSTERGNFTVNVLTADLNQIRVMTDTANSDNCYDNCPTKPLAAYVAENGGFAAINGTYFCPPDYSACSGKVASYDFPVYNSNLGKFLNSDKLFWSARAMIAFDTAGGAHFFREANSFGGISLAAAIVNYPALVAGGQIVVDEGSLSANLGQVKGNRGALGFSGNTLFAVVGRSATVGDMAYVMKALGADHAMNLDGGGSSALYFNGYKVGPGRNLPNAVVFK